MQDRHENAEKRGEGVKINIVRAEKLQNEDRGTVDHREAAAKADIHPFVHAAEHRGVLIGSLRPGEKGGKLKKAGEEERLEGLHIDAERNIGDCVKDRVQAADQKAVSVGLGGQHADEKRNVKRKHEVEGRGKDAIGGRDSDGCQDKQKTARCENIECFFHKIPLRIKLYLYYNEVFRKKQFSNEPFF